MTSRPSGPMTMLVGAKGAAVEVFEATSAWRRMKGLLGTDELPQRTALLMRGKQVHTFWMKYPIDVVYLDKEHRVLKVSSLRPNKLGPFLWRAAYVLEMAEGQAGGLGIKPGLRMETR